MLLAIGVLGSLIYWRLARNTPTDASESPGSKTNEAVPYDFRELSPDVKAALIRNSNGQILPDLFRNVATQSGIEFTYRNSQAGADECVLAPIDYGELQAVLTRAIQKRLHELEGRRVASALRALPIGRRILLLP